MAANLLRFFLPRGAKRSHALLMAIPFFLVLGWVGASSNSHERERLRQAATERFGQSGLQAISAWIQLIDFAKRESVTEQLALVNEFVNARTLFQSDEQTWGQVDYWATPVELFGRGRGDCEDIAIAKYVSLIALGVPESRLRLIYVKAQTGAPGLRTSVAHMVLGYYASPDAEPQILDNLVGSIQRASARTDLTPVFSFNGAGLWAGTTLTPGDPTERLSRWRRVLARLEQEGMP